MVKWEEILEKYFKYYIIESSILFGRCLVVKEKYAILLINDTALFPNCEMRIETDVLQDLQVLSVTESSFTKKILIVNPIVTSTNHLDITDLPKIGILAQLKMKMDVPNGKTRAVLYGLERVFLSNVIAGDYYEAEIEKIEFSGGVEEESYKSILIKALHKYINKAPYVGNAILNQVEMFHTLDELTDLVISFLPFSYEKKKRYVIETDAMRRVRMLIEDMNEDLKIIQLEEKIEQDVEQELAQTQKEFILREKMRIIQKELGEGNSKEEEIERLKRKLSTLKCSPKIKARIKEEIKRYETIPAHSPEIGMLRDYLEWMLTLPWCHYTKDTASLGEVERVLNSTHYALGTVKERILEYLAVKQNTNHSRSPILCLVGPPGVGKTSLALSIAKSLNRKSTKISVGGINDEAEIVGHRRTYIGANPGRIIQGIKKAGTTNPVFIIDEIDKMRKDIKGDPASSLLEVLDPEQNHKFSDHYIEEEFDLSKVMFIATANYAEQIPFELRDRLEIIELSSYTEYEKLDIAKNHLIPKELEEHGLTSISVQFDDDAILTLIRYYTKEAGVRELQRVIASLLRKIVKSFLTDKMRADYQVNYKLIENFLGKPKYHYQQPELITFPGVVNGLAYTQFGGDILPIEATYYKGNGNLILTGSLGEVMQESARIAFSYLKANVKRFGIDPLILQENDIHIHVPEGAVNKEGPSAGVSLTTTLISMLTCQSVDTSIAMTGEITLQGRVLAIGGLLEKVIGAHRAGIKKIFLPYANKNDLEEIPEEIKNEIEFILVKNYFDIYKQVFKVREIIGV